jgi:glycogen operon protein
MTASSDLFRHAGRAPRASINHITVHDGFTLADLVSYAEKHNEGNGEDNRDGAEDNHCSNWGEEGPTSDPAIRALRQRARKNLLTSLFLAQGVPLLLAGDEVGNSQNGNNNAYCHDNDIGWIDWSGAGTENDLTELISKLTRLRERYPQLKGRHWLLGTRPDGSNDIRWITPQASDMKEEDWTYPDARYLAYVLGPIEPQGAPIFIVLNAAPETVRYVMPGWADFTKWEQLLATAISGAEQSEQVIEAGAERNAEARSITVYGGLR